MITDRLAKTFPWIDRRLEQVGLVRLGAMLLGLTAIELALTIVLCFKVWCRP